MKKRIATKKINEILIYSYENISYYKEAFNKKGKNLFIIINSSK
ncbi:hypothetical protein [Fusobacterium mortiferum]|nr:hypothetical protein [Fusobacterium mortiferum]